MNRTEKVKSVDPAEFTPEEIDQVEGVFAYMTGAIGEGTSTRVSLSPEIQALMRRVSEHFSRTVRGGQ